MTIKFLENDGTVRDAVQPTTASPQQWMFDAALQGLKEVENIDGTTQQDRARRLSVHIARHAPKSVDVSEPTERQVDMFCRWQTGDYKCTVSEAQELAGFILGKARKMQAEIARYRAALEKIRISASSARLANKPEMLSRVIVIHGIAIDTLAPPPVGS
jgi:hypothetical protein